MKKSFIIHLDSLEVLDELTDVQVAKLFRAFRDYHSGIEPELDQILRIAFVPFKLQFERDLEKYQATSERNSLNGSQGGRPKKSESKENQKNPLAFSAFSENQQKPKKADSDNDSENDSDRDLNKRVKKQFIPPTKEDVKAYFIENGESLSFLDKCFSYYADANWTNRDGKKVKDWKRTIKTNWFGKNQKEASHYVPAEKPGEWRPPHHKLLDFSGTIETR